MEKSILRSFYCKEGLGWDCFEDAASEHMMDTSEKVSLFLGPFTK